MSISGVSAAAGATGAVLWSGMLARILLVAAALASAAGGSGAAEEVAWRDIESRIQYGYYTEDSAALRKLEELIASGDPRDKLRGYYAGLLAWRRALLAAGGGAAAQGGSPAHYAQRCVSEVDTALALEADFAEALALRAACLAAPQEVGGGGFAPLAGHRAHKDLERARQLAKRNPRVLLVDAMSDYALAPSQGGNKERALGKLRQAVAAFEAERSGSDHLPGWGAAEAWLYGGRARCAGACTAAGTGVRRGAPSHGEIHFRLTARP